MSTNHEDQADVPESSGTREPQMAREPGYRHTPYQCEMMEAYFNEWGHPDEKTRQEIGRAIGLTAMQVKFWFQNRRSYMKGQSERAEGDFLRAENNRLNAENYSLKELLNSGCCNVCKSANPITFEPYNNVGQLLAQNMQIKQEYSSMCNVLVNMGIPIPKNSDVSPPIVTHVPSDGPSNPQLDFEISKMIQATQLARDEIMTLLHSNEPFWLRDRTDGRLIINRETYNCRFVETSSVRDNLFGSRTRFESSKNEEFLSMTASEVAQMLIDSTKRLDLFPTILTESFTIKEYSNQISNGQFGNLKLVYEQMHILSPCVAPREFCFLRFCENISEGEWLIGETSLDFLTNGFELRSPTHAWRLPSGCIIKDVSPGISKVVWMEHVEIHDRASSIHLLYKDVLFRGLAFGADRWVGVLSRSIHIINSYSDNSMNQIVSSRQHTSNNGSITTEEKKCIISIAEKITKRFCVYMNMKNRLNIPRPINNEISLSLCQGEYYNNPSDGLVVNVATSFWLPAPCETILDFLKNPSLRAQWDVLCEGRPAKVVACITFGDQPNNSISLIQRFGDAGKKILLIQETLVDAHGAIVVYAPIKMEDIKAELAGFAMRLILPSGFIITRDGNPDCSAIEGEASTSGGPMVNGSLVTVAFQAACDSDIVEMEFENMVSSLITKIVSTIKIAFNYSD